VTDVIDATALLAFLQDEPGANDVRLTDAVMSSVNFSEVLHAVTADRAWSGLGDVVRVRVIR
jgi:PIN domain nuclease of toxin-antitoxin system